MNTEEKLQHFLDTCMEDARTRSSRMLDDYMSALLKTFEEHQADAKRHADMQLHQEAEKIEHAINKKLAIEQIAIKRKLGQKQDELRDKLFVELKDLLANFMETQDYQKLLEHQIQKAVEFADGAELIVYLDPVDEDKLQRLAMHHSAAQLKLSEYSFTGGTRAVIPSRHILIDNSFQTKLAEAKEKFTAKGGFFHV